MRLSTMTSKFNIDTFKIWFAFTVVTGVSPEVLWRSLIKVSSVPNWHRRPGIAVGMKRLERRVPAYLWSPRMNISILRDLELKARQTKESGTIRVKRLITRWTEAIEKHRTDDSWELRAFKLRQNTSDCRPSDYCRYVIRTQVELNLSSKH